MGQSSSFELHGWKANGKGLPVATKHAIQDAIYEEDFDEYSTDCNETDSFVTSFGSEYYGAYDTACKVLSGYAVEHEDVLLELYYDCEEANEFHAIRFRGKETEEYDRVEVYPPFVRLTIPDEKCPLPTLEFHFASVGGGPEASVLVLLNCDPSEETLKQLEDSIASYCESVHAWSYEQLIHEVLSAENIGHWIISPTHTFHI